METFFGLNPNDAGTPPAIPTATAGERAAGQHANGVHMPYWKSSTPATSSTLVGVLIGRDGDGVSDRVLNEDARSFSHRFTLAPRARRSVSINQVLGSRAAVAIVGIRRAVGRGSLDDVGNDRESGHRPLRQRRARAGDDVVLSKSAPGPFLLYYLFEIPG